MELTLEQALQKGIEAHKAGKAQEADRYYTAILKANPKHSDANHNMGVLAVGVGKVQEALPFFKTALEVNPSIAQYWLSYIDALIKLDQIDDAKAATLSEKILKLDPLDEKIFASLALCHQNLKNYNQAIVFYEKALSIKPDYFEAWVNLGSAFKKLGNLKAAIDIYKKILELKPDYAVAHNNMGNAFQDQGKLEKAIGAYKKALSLKPDYFEAYFNMGNALKLNGKINEALESYHTAISIEPDYAVAYNNIGNTLKDQGRLEEAIKFYKKAIFIKPDYAEAYNNMGVTLQNQDKLDEAIQAYNKAISLKPDYAIAYNNMGVTLKDQGKLDQAIEAYKNTLLLEPDYAEAFNNMGVTLVEQCQLKQAIKAFEKALSLKPDYGNAKHMLSALTGKTNRTAPREYVENLFNGYADKFEVSLVSKLEYRIPKFIKDLLTKSDPNASLGSVLDLGCGTGLLGPEIKHRCSKLEGIDLSKRMLTVADKKNVYDKLSHFDIVEYLSSKPLDFDYYLALDVFIYVGELTDIFHLIKSRNKKPGKLVFSTEHTEQDGYHLLESGRYSHSRSYIESLCKKFDYNVTHFSTANLRKEKGHFLTGGIYILEFTAEN